MNLSVGFDRILAEARKYKLVLAGLANQYVGQLSTEVRHAIFGNVGVFAVFRLGVDDAQTVAKEMGVFTAEEIMSLELGEALVRVGGSQKSYNIQTYPDPALPMDDPLERIVTNTRAKYARPRKEVEAELAEAEVAFPGTVTPPKVDTKTKTKGKTTAKPPKPRRAKQRDEQIVDPSEDDLVVQDKPPACRRGCN